MSVRHLARVFGLLGGSFAAVEATQSLVYAGIITGVQPGGFDLSGVTPAPSKPNNNDFTGPGPTSPNSIGAGKVFNNNNAIVHVFTVANSGGTTEYFFAERVDNLTGVDWIDFHFELIGALGREDDLDFDTGTPMTPERTPAPSSSNFTRLNHQPTTLDWDSGVVSNGRGVDFTFSIDVPDGITTFTLLERPSVVPEPSTFALSGAILAALILVARWMRGRTTACGSVSTSVPNR